MAQIQRRKTYTAVVGGVRVGSDVPIVVQSMTNTDTADIDGTIRQCMALARAGSELVRVTVNNDAAAEAVPHIVVFQRQIELIPQEAHIALNRFRREDRKSEL